MTIVAAYRTGRSVAIASDSYGTDGWGIQDDHGSKLERFPWGAVGFTASYRTLGVIRGALAETKRLSTLRDAEVARDAIAEALKGAGWKAEHADRLPRNDDLWLLAVSWNSGRIFTIQRNLAVLESKRYAAIGSGYQVALGAMHAWRRPRNAKSGLAESVARGAVKAACAHVSTCAGRVYSMASEG